MNSEFRRRDLLFGAAAAAAGAALPPGVAPMAKTGGAAASREYAYGNAADLVRALAAKRISSVELTDDAIARIEALDKAINAVVARDFDRARQAAKAADAALARGESGALLGLPMTVMEMFGVAGLPTTCGNPKFRDWKAPVDAPVISRLKAAGAVILGKTNSAGGAAAALAAGFVALELGSDSGGSLPCPAHFCGVFAHQPSLDLVPLRGAGPSAAPASPVCRGLAAAGPMARSAADLALELQVIAGPDEVPQGVGYKLALPPARHQDLPGFRVLVVDTRPLCPTAATMRGAFEQLADRLSRAGAKVARAGKLYPDQESAARVYDALLTAEPTAEQRDWIAATRTQARIGQQWRELAKSFDVVLCPASPTPAFPHDHQRRRLNIDGTEVPYRHPLVWAGMASLLGLPATVAPIAQSAEGLPVGVQIIGPYLEDRTTIAFAGLVEREFGGFVPPAAALTRAQRV